MKSHLNRTQHVVSSFTDLWELHVWGRRKVAMSRGILSFSHQAPCRCQGSSLHVAVCAVLSGSFQYLPVTAARSDWPTSTRPIPHARSVKNIMIMLFWYDHSQNAMKDSKLPFRTTLYNRTQRTSYGSTTWVVEKFEGLCLFDLNAVYMKIYTEWCIMQLRTLSGFPSHWKHYLFLQDYVFNHKWLNYFLL